MNNSEIEAGWYGALAKKYPKAIKDFGTGGENQASILEQEHKDEQAAVAQGYKVVDFQEPPLNVTDWAPYIEEAQAKGVEALEPSASSNVGPYFQAMQTAGYSPAFVYMYENLYVKATAQATASIHLPPTYLALALALRASFAEPGPHGARGRHAQVRRRHRYRPERRAGGQLLGALRQVSHGLWRRPHGLLRVEPRRRPEELERGRHPSAYGPVGHVGPEPHPE